MGADEPLFLGAYWGPREDSVEQCAAMLSDCLTRLAACHELLTGWARKARSRRAAEDAVVEASAGALRELVCAGASRNDSDGSPIVELGFSVALWNRGREAPIGLSVRCGATTRAQGVMNSCVLDLPAPDDAGAALYKRETALCMVRAVVETWRPDWATLTSYSLADALDPAPREPCVGWITYLSRDRPVPTEAAAEREDLAGGTALVVSDRIEEIELEKLASLARELDSAGALAPTPL